MSIDEALELPDSAEQIECLQQASVGNEKLQAQVEALLRWPREAASLLEVPAVDRNAGLEISAMHGRENRHGHWAVEAPGEERQWLAWLSRSTRSAAKWPSRSSHSA